VPAASRSDPENSRHILQLRILCPSQYHGRFEGGISYPRIGLSDLFDRDIDEILRRGLQILRVDLWPPDDRLDHRRRDQKHVGHFVLRSPRDRSTVDLKASQSLSPQINLSRLVCIGPRQLSSGTNFWRKNIERCTLRLVPPATRPPRR